MNYNGINVRIGYNGQVFNEPNQNFVCEICGVENDICDHHWILGHHICSNCFNPAFEKMKMDLIAKIGKEVKQ